MSEIERTDLARERTSASWIRTCLALVVSSLALRYYTNDVLFSIALAVSGVLAALRALRLAEDWSVALMCAAIGAVSAGSMFLVVS